MVLLAEKVVVWIDARVTLRQAWTSRLHLNLSPNVRGSPPSKRKGGPKKILQLT